MYLKLNLKWTQVVLGWCLLNQMYPFETFIYSFYQSVHLSVINWLNSHCVPGIMEGTKIKYICTVTNFLEVRILPFFQLLRKLLSQICPQILQILKIKVNGLCLQSEYRLEGSPIHSPSSCHSVIQVSSILWLHHQWVFSSNYWWWERKKAWRMSWLVFRVRPGSDTHNSGHIPLAQA